MNELELLRALRGACGDLLVALDDSCIVDMADREDGLYPMDRDERACICDATSLVRDLLYLLHEKAPPANLSPVPDTHKDGAA